MVKTTQQMINFGKRLAAILPPVGGIIYLKGDLGVGKTTLVRGTLQGLGYAGKVKSPSFSLIEVYPIPPVPVCHLDLYRLNHPTEISELGYEEYLDNSYSFIEWPEVGENWLPPADLEIHITLLTHSTRQITLFANSRWGKTVQSKLKP